MDTEKWTAFENISQKLYMIELLWGEKGRVYHMNEFKDDFFFEIPYCCRVAFWKENDIILSQRARKRIWKESDFSSKRQTDNTLFSSEPKDYAAYFPFNIFSAWLFVWHLWRCMYNTATCTLYGLKNFPIRCMKSNHGLTHLYLEWNIERSVAGTLSFPHLSWLRLYIYRVLSERTENSLQNCCTQDSREYIYFNTYFALEYSFHYIPYEHNCTFSLN